MLDDDSDDDDPEVDVDDVEDPELESPPGVYIIYFLSYRFFNTSISFVVSSPNVGMDDGDQNGDMAAHTQGHTGSDFSCNYIYQNQYDNLRKAVHILLSFNFRFSLPVERSKRKWSEQENSVLRDLLRKKRKIGSAEMREVIPLLNNRSLAQIRAKLNNVHLGKCTL